MSAGEKKVLGVRWNLAADQFIVSLEEIASMALDLEPTKRQIVSLVGRVYDPLGLISPVVTQLKIFVQELCEAKVNWDQLLTDQTLEKWKQLSRNLCEAPSLLIPRCFLYGVGEHVISYSLSGFCDASLKAYAAVVYLCLETESGRNITFVASKTRVSPLKAQTIPRLELLSALLLARLMESITQALRDELCLSEPRCFSDSNVTVFWIRGVDKTWKPFVQNRVSEIRRLVAQNHWHHCSGRDNPADIPSRGCTPQQLSESQLWRSGPEWLKTIEMPKPEALEDQMPEGCQVEMKAETSHGLLVATESAGIGQIIRCENFSSLTRLLTVTAHVLKFCQLLCDKVHPDSEITTQDEFVEAESLWITESQKFLVNEKNFHQWKNQLDLFCDDRGIWRCKGRIQNADVPFSTKHPILLTRQHHLAELLVRRAHDRVFHGGVKSTLTELRSQYWIVRGRSYVRQILRKCVHCKRFEGRPYRPPNPPPLPLFRVDEAPPFTYTGVDFAGPLYAKEASTLKVWICLFTCCVTRAVHIDIVQDLSTPSFIRCLKRFVARRGLPTRFVSDNGKTFEAAAKILHTVVNHSDVQKHVSGLGIQWTFNLPKSPWWGGVFERLIRSTKRCLRKIIGRAKLTLDELLTAVVEVEAVLNACPLTYVSMDDFDEPLTPSHLLTGRRIWNLPDNLCRDSEEASDVDARREVLTRRVRHLNRSLDQFWTRWRKEYLLELREAHRQNRGHNKSSEVAIGDIVLVHSEDRPRGFWRLGRIKKHVTGRDGKVRGAIVQVSGKGRQATSLQRPIQLLYPLEVPHPSSEEPTVSTETIDCTADVSPNQNSPLRRSRRAAALEARDRIMAQALEPDH